MITTFYPPYSFGGDGVFVQQLSKELAKRGHEVEVIHCIDAYRLLARHEPEKSYEGYPKVTVHGLKSPFGYLSPLTTHQTGFPLFKSARIQAILKKGFDVIHYHNISLVGGPKILEYGQGIKLYTLHEYWLVCPTHMLFRFNRAPCTARHCFRCSLAYKRPPQWWRYFGLLEAAAKHVDAFIAPSHFSKRLHQTELDIPIVYLPNFAPSLDIAPLPSDGKSPGKPYFLFVGRLEKLKGVQTLIPLFHRYRKAQLWIAGTGSYESELRQLAEGNDNVRFLGYLSDRQLLSLYRQAVALIVPSVFYENFPLVIIEAFRQQTPVIARNLGGLLEIVGDRTGGIVYNSDEELEAAMNQLLRDPSYQRQLGLRGYKAYKQNWTAQTHLRRYFQLIREITARDRSLA